MATRIGLQYIGLGATRPGLPARDIDAAELAHFDAERVEMGIAAGLYRAMFAEEEPAEPGLAALKKADLLEMAAERGLDLGKRPTNAALIEAITAFDEAKANPPAAVAEEEPAEPAPPQGEEPEEPGEGADVSTRSDDDQAESEGGNNS